MGEVMGEDGQKIIDSISRWKIDIGKQDIWDIALTIVISIVLMFILNIIFNKVKVHKNTMGVRYLNNIGKVAVIVWGVINVIDCIDKTKSITTTLKACGGIVIAVIGLSAKEAIANIVDGIMISMFRPFELGDRVSVADKNINGIVEDITIRHTIIRTYNNTRYIIPNSIMNGAIIENSHFQDTKVNAFIDISVAYEVDLRKAIKIIQDTVKGYDNFVTDGSYQSSSITGVSEVPVFVREYQESGIQLRVTVTSEDVGKSFQSCSDLRILIKEAFDKEGIEIPYSKLHIVNCDLKENRQEEKEIAESK